jgi:membrane protein
MQADRLMAIAAGVVFYSLLALFPAITAGVSIYALFADAGTIGKNVAQLSTVLPGGTIDIVSEQITRINQHGTGALSLGFVVGLGVALWSANAGMKALFDSLNVIYDEEEKRGFIKLNAVSMLFTLGAIALAFLMLMCVAVVPFLLQRVGLPSTAAQIIAYGRWVLLLAIGIGAMTVLYRIGPSRAPAQWRWLIFGSIFATIGWLAVSMLFSWYVANFGTYNATYGSLGAVVGMMMWMWLSMIVVLLGAELNSEIEHQTARDSTTEPPRPLGARGAVVADTVGSAKS